MRFGWNCGNHVNYKLYFLCKSRDFLWLNASGSSPWPSANNFDRGAGCTTVRQDQPTFFRPIFYPAIACRLGSLFSFRALAPSRSLHLTLLLFSSTYNITTITYSISSSSVVIGLISSRIEPTDYQTQSLPAPKHHDVKYNKVFSNSASAMASRISKRTSTRSPSNETEHDRTHEKMFISIQMWSAYGDTKGWGRFGPWPSRCALLFRFDLDVYIAIDTEICTRLTLPAWPDIPLSSIRNFYTLSQ